MTQGGSAHAWNADNPHDSAQMPPDLRIVARAIGRAPDDRHAVSMPSIRRINPLDVSLSMDLIDPWFFFPSNSLHLFQIFALMSFSYCSDDAELGRICGLLPECPVVESEPAQLGGNRCRGWGSPPLRYCSTPRSGGIAAT